MDKNLIEIYQRLNQLEALFYTNGNTIRNYPQLSPNISIQSNTTISGVTNISGNVTLSSSSNFTMTSGATSTILNAPNTASNFLRLNVTRSGNNSILSEYSQYSDSLTSNFGISFIRYRNTLDLPNSALQGDSLGGFYGRSYVSGGASPTFSTYIQRFIATENHDNTNRGTGYQILLTPSGSAGGRRIVFGIDSNGEATLGRNFRLPEFNLYVKDIYVTGNILPMVNDSSDVGSPTFLFNDVYATNGVITVSDPSYKKDISKLSFSSIDFVKNIEALEYRLINGNRLHIGFNAKDVKDYFDKINKDYALFIENDKLMLRYQEMIPILFDVNKKLIERIELIEYKQKNMFIKIYDYIKGLFK